MIQWGMKCDEKSCSLQVNESETSRISYVFQGASMI